MPVKRQRSTSALGHEETRRPRDPRDRSSSVTGPRCGGRSGTPGKAPRRGRRHAKRNNLADKLTVEAKALADLKIEKAAVEGERRKVEADLGPVKYLRRWSAPRMMTCCATSSSWTPYSSREAPCPRT